MLKPSTLIALPLISPNFMKSGPIQVCPTTPLSVQEVESDKMCQNSPTAMHALPTWAFGMVMIAPALLTIITKIS